MNRFARIGSIFALGIVTSVAAAGDLNPPAGPVASTPGPEPRKPIDAIHTPGDADSVYRIIVPGSYYLTGNVAGVVGKRGIEVSANGVTIDLMGFDVLGVVGSLEGICLIGASANSIEIRNGAVRNWGLEGVKLAQVTSGHIDSVRVHGNGSFGIYVGNGFVVNQCEAANNGGVGIYVINGCTVTNCAAYDNVDFGIFANSGATITGCAARLNGSSGFGLGNSSTIAQCTSTSNGDHGITLTTDCLALENLCDGNGAASALTDGAGIRITGADCRVEANNCIDNDIGIDCNSAGSFFSRNTCSSNDTNWDIAAGNVILVLNAATNDAFSGDAGGLSPGSSNPNANYTY